MNEQEQRGRIAFEAFKAERWPSGPEWRYCSLNEQSAWITAAEAVYKTTQCYFDLEGQKSADSHAPKVTL